jgi:hypothetical protein
MDLLKVVRHSDPQYFAGSVRESKCTRLGYEIRLSRLHTLDPPLALALPRDSHLVTQNPKQENNQGTPSISQVPQADPPAIRLHSSYINQDREKVTDHMRYKYAKRDLKLKHNSMNIVTHRVRHNELVVPPEPTPRVGR